jgi:predicted dehydrogenase
MTGTDPVVPEVAYRPRGPESYDPGIGLVGCGGVTKHHLNAYREAGYDVRAFCDLDRKRAEKRRDTYYPNADVYADHHELLAREDVEVVDVATHPTVRAPLVEDAIDAGKHVLSQKPFVLDLDVGDGLVERAAEEGVRLAVNQNGRWAPHFSYVRNAAKQGLLGEVVDVDCGVHWDHDWIAETPFDDVEHVITFDFGIHWYDLLSCLRDDPVRVYASTARSPAQNATPSLLAQVQVEYDDAQASLTFGGNTRYRTGSRTFVGGTEGSVESTGAIVSCGPTSGEQTVTLEIADGTVVPALDGQWFPTGFQGSMAELLRAIEEDREPTHSGRDNLQSLELCFAAVESATRNDSVEPGTVRTLPGSD